jgi:tetratricopeptide (TPR) repeat protein
MSASAPSRPMDQATGKSDCDSDIARAQSILRGVEVPAQEMYDLAERLKNDNAFGYARRLYGRIRTRRMYAGLKQTPTKVGQRHALCTYKDPDLAAADRFKHALEILDEIDLLGLTPVEKQESLGLRGAVYKRIWQVEGQRADLECSLGYYLKGYEMGSEKDQGYTGINAAFVLDLLALEDARQAKKICGNTTAAEQHWRRARDIRRRLVGLLPKLLSKPQSDWLKKEWWFYTTQAEAHFGLGEFDQALSSLRAYNRALDLKHERPPLEKIGRWELETTIMQLVSLGQVQEEIGMLLENQAHTGQEPVYSPVDWRLEAQQTLREYLGDLAPGVDRALAASWGWPSPVGDFGPRSFTSASSRFSASAMYCGGSKCSPACQVGRS